MTGDGVAWTFDHSVDCGVTVEFAWAFWTDVRNWAIEADVISVEIDGPFASGARGFTNSKSPGRIDWRVVEARPDRAVIEFQVPGARGRFVWTFEDVEGRTRMTQRCTLEGEQAGELAKIVGPSLEAGIPGGMRKLCEAMEAALRTDRIHQDQVDAYPSRQGYKWAEVKRDAEPLPTGLRQRLTRARDELYNARLS